MQSPLKPRGDGGNGYSARALRHNRQPTAPESNPPRPYGLQWVRCYWVFHLVPHCRTAAPERETKTGSHSGSTRYGVTGYSTQRPWPFRLNWVWRHWVFDPAPVGIPGYLTQHPLASLSTDSARMKTPATLRSSMAPVGVTVKRRHPKEKQADSHSGSTVHGVTGYSTQRPWRHCPSTAPNITPHGHSGSTGEQTPYHPRVSEPFPLKTRIVYPEEDKEKERSPEKS
ncbi:hypothetical protein B0H14DRAFT_2621847 [Mycena olivaceomarginata]|nr:hypothetical protein B0H14DRAFT_2621847 [Mycena olivaceomarginata]